MLSLNSLFIDDCSSSQNLDELIKFSQFSQIHDEIAIMRALKHPKLLQLFAVFESQREIVMILE